MALQDSLISYWKLDEASGQRNDSHGANHLTDNNTVTQNPGKIGNAAQFTAANSEYLSRADNADLSLGDIDFSLTGWFYLDTKAGVMNPVSKWAGAGSLEWKLEYDNALDRLAFYVSPNGTAQVNVTANNFGAVPTATWLFVAVWHDAINNTINIQINNGTVNSAAHATGVFDGAEAFRIGTYGSLIRFWNGRIDEVGFWKRVLTAAERTALYNGGGGRAYPFTNTLTASPLSTGGATLGVPALGQTHHVTAAGLATGPAVLGLPALSQLHALAAVPLATGATHLGTPTITHVHTLAAPGIVTGAALLAMPALGQSHPLVALNLANGAAILGQPAFFVPPFSPAPNVRVIQVPAASRVTRVING